MLMVAAILLIVAFQAYWLQKLFMEEAAGFKKTTDIVFRETMYKVQAQRLKKDSLFYQIIQKCSHIGWSGVMFANTMSGSQPYV